MPPLVLLRCSAIAWVTATGLLLTAVPVGGQEPRLPADDSVPFGAERRLGTSGAKKVQEGVTALTYSPDSRLLATRTVVHSVHLWDVATGQQQFAWDPQQLTCRDFAFTPNAEYLVTTAPDEIAETGRGTRIFNTSTGSEEFSLPIYGRKVRITPNNELIVAADGIWQRTAIPPLGRALRRPLIGTHQLIPLELSIDGQFVAAIDRKTLDAPIEHSARLLHIDLKRPNSVREIEEIRHSPWMARFVPATNGQWIAFCYRGDRRVVLHQLSSPQRSFKLTGPDHAVTCIAVSPDGRHLAAGHVDGTVWIWEIMTRRLVGQLRDHGDKITALAFSPDLQQLAVGMAGLTDNGVVLWPVITRLVQADGTPFVPTGGFDVDSDLGAADPLVAYSLMGRMLASPATAVPVLEEVLCQPRQPLPAAELEALVSDLGHPRYGVRHHAYQTLFRIRERVLPQLRYALEDCDSLEVAMQLRRIIANDNTAKRAYAGQELRKLLRSVFTLELINSPESHRLLAQAHQAHDSEVVRTAAGNALTRLTPRQAR